MDYTCEQCGDSGTLCVSDWGYIAALCDTCLSDRKNYLKLPPAETSEPAQPAASASTAA